MLYNVEVLHNGEKITVQIDEQEVFRLNEQIALAKMAKRVEECLTAKCPDAKYLLGEKYSKVLNGIAYEFLDYTSTEGIDVQDVAKEDICDELDERLFPFGEIRTNYTDEDAGFTCVDAWYTEDDNEEGIVVAKIFDDGRVEFTEECYSEKLDVLRAIDRFKNSI